MSRAQVNVISITLIVILSIVLVGTGYLWIKPLIEKKQDTLKVEKLLSDFSQENLDSLPRKIEHVAKTQAEVSFTISSDGIWRLYPSSYVGLENNSIEFFTFSKAITGKISVGMWKSFVEGVTCPPSKGRIGEIPYVVCVRADTFADGYNVTYKIIFRELEGVTRGSKINLEKWTAISPETSTSRDIKIKRGDIYSRFLDTKTLIITEVKFSLV
ncbi:MAG: hypothetical protein QMD14_00965 [Candidatus Aenigmarchaeota archaeon]|nr:hypothetical protein [Candidatus Aenigmarchaeota archaeon]